MIVKLHPLQPPKTNETSEHISERLYVGIDIGKNSHHIAFLSNSLLSQSQRKHYTHCPTQKIDNSRSGFEGLVKSMQAYAPLDHCTVLMERTGHYGAALQQYLLECGIEVYEVHVSKKALKLKTDKRDALNLANTLYNQRERGVQPSEAIDELRRLVAPSEAAAALRSLTRQRYELMQSIGRISNKLTSILDELFPEFDQILGGCSETALNIRERFGSAEHVAAADFKEIRACRTWKFPGDKALHRLQDAAAQSIGVTAPGRVAALCKEQVQLIEELRLKQRHSQEIDDEIAAILAESREGKILLSFGCVGPMAAATIIAVIGNIENFSSAAKLKGCSGWCPNHKQTGKSMDHMEISRGGNRMLRHTMFLVGLRAVKADGGEWHDLYESMVPRMCQFDERLGRYHGKKKPLGHIIGRIVTKIYWLLKKDADLVASTAPGQEVPPPTLYTRKKH